jgi:hypothetical protein
MRIIREEDLTDIEMGGVDGADYPDFCDAYVESAELDGIPLTGEELDSISSDFIYEQSLNIFI